MKLSLHFPLYNAVFGMTYILESVTEDDDHDQSCTDDKMLGSHCANVRACILPVVSILFKSCKEQSCYPSTKSSLRLVFVFRVSNVQCCP